MGGSWVPVGGWEGGQTMRCVEVCRNAIAILGIAEAIVIAGAVAIAEAIAIADALR